MLHAAELRSPSLKTTPDKKRSMLEMNSDKHGLPLISIVTPCWNRAYYIEEAINSVLTQDYSNVEHIIVDGGSVDGTLDILKKFRHLRVISEPDKGMYDAINKGLCVARGEVIGFLNSDDIYAEDVLLEVGRRFVADPKLDMLCGGHAVFEGDFGGGYRLLLTRNCLAEGLSLAELTLGVPAFNARFFRRRLFDRLGDFDLRFLIASDRDFLIRAALSDTRSATLPRTIYFYRQHEGSRTLNPRRLNARDIAREHAEIAELRLADDALASRDRRRLSGWHAYESAKLAAWGLAALRVMSALWWLARAGRHSAFWPWSVIASLWTKLALAHGRFRESGRPGGGCRPVSG